MVCPHYWEADLLHTVKKNKQPININICWFDCIFAFALFHLAVILYFDLKAWWPDPHWARCHYGCYVLWVALESFPRFGSRDARVVYSFNGLEIYIFTGERNTTYASPRWGMQYILCGWIFARRFALEGEDDDESSCFLVGASLFQKLRGAQQKVTAWKTTVASCIRTAVKSCRSHKRPIGTGSRQSSKFRWEPGAPWGSLFLRLSIYETNSLEGETTRNSFILAQKPENYGLRGETSVNIWAVGAWDT